MAKQQPPEGKPARNSTRTPGKAGPQPTGNEVHASSSASKRRPPRETGGEQGGGSAPQQGSATDIENLQQTATQYFRRLTGSAGELSTQARRVYDNSQGYVRSHPAQSLGGAFVAGLVLGLLMGRD